MTGQWVALDGLVCRARRRMRLNRALTAAGWALPVCGAVAAAWIALSRTVVLPALDAWIAAALTVAGLVAVLAAAVVRIPALWAAWAADRWLAGRERFATAVELIGRGPLRGLAAHQVAQAERAAAGITAWPQRPRLPTRRLGIGVALAAVALVGGLAPNPQDTARAQRAQEHGAVAVQADALRAAADDLGAPGQTAAERELAQRLRSLAADLDRAGLEAALQRLAEERAELAGRMDPDRAAQRTALAGLARELSADPLAPGQDAAAQLESLAGRLAADPARADAALAARLERLAAALSVGAPSLARALGEAAAAAAAGDAAAASRALGEASQAVGQAGDRLSDQEAVAIADAALSQAQTGLGALAGRPTAPGRQPGSGGNGGGGGGGGGGAAGNPTGVDDGGARRGRGQALDPRAQGGGDGQQPASDLDLQTVYDPPERLGGDGEDVRLGGADSGRGAAGDVGRAQGQGTSGAGLVPYLDVLGDYARQASRTIERPGYPTRLRTTVADYFDRLGAER